MLEIIIGSISCKGNCLTHCTISSIPKLESLNYFRGFFVCLFVVCHQRTETNKIFGCYHYRDLTKNWQHISEVIKLCLELAELAWKQPILWLPTLKTWAKCLNFLFAIVFSAAEKIMVRVIKLNLQVIKSMFILPVGWYNKDNCMINTNIVLITLNLI